MNIKLVQPCGMFCAILSQEIGEEPYSGIPVIGYFPALCIDNGAKPCHASHATDFIRLSETKEARPGDIERWSAWCVGYNRALLDKKEGHRFGAIPAVKVSKTPDQKLDETATIVASGQSGD